jgi:hypothetical protein
MGVSFRAVAPADSATPVGASIASGRSSFSDHNVNFNIDSASHFVNIPSNRLVRLQ